MHRLWHSAIIDSDGCAFCEDIPPPVKSHNFDYVLEYDNSGDCDEDKYDDDAY